MTDILLQIWENLTFLLSSPSHEWYIQSKYYELTFGVDLVISLFLRQCDLGGVGGGVWIGKRSVPRQVTKGESEPSGSEDQARAMEVGGRIRGDGSQWTPSSW